MCGIVGSVNFRLTPSVINEKMGHRGPDEQASWSSGNVEFYHLRLSIVDISGGKQPMTLDDRYTIIFNGEIYNHNALRKQFGLQGTTSSDTETLLLLYRKMGMDFLNHLDGMFVLALYDAQTKQLIIARDRAGKKPLYYFTDGHKLVFASELNCLKGLLPLQMEPAHFLPYLRLGTFYRNQTPYKNVTELTGGHYLSIDCNSLQLQQIKWWDIHTHYLNSSSDDFETALSKTENYLKQAVQRRIDSSDLEVGCFLSGGIDSGLITAMAAGVNNRLQTFTVSFKGEYNEAPLAKLVADKYGTRHTEIGISFDHLKDDVEKIIANYGEPFFDSSAIPSYYVSREARKHVTVVLNGDGADELFAGYRRYVPFAKYDFFKRSALIAGTARAAKKILPPGNSKKSKYNYLYRLLSLASKSDLEIYLAAGVDILEDFEKHILADSSDYMAQVRTDFETITGSSLSGLKKLMNMDFDTNLFNDLLVKMDIATMANSQEGRSAFLCKELLEYIPGINDSYKIKGTTTKYLLRQLAQRYLPAELINQPKRGFEIPLKNWIDMELNSIIMDYLHAPNACHRQFISPAFTENLLTRKVKMSDEKRAKIIWMLFCLEVWYQKIYLQ